MAIPDERRSLRRRRPAAAKTVSRRCESPKKSHRRLLHRDQLPKAMWINEHIHSAYRPTDLTVGHCFKSHLIGFLYFFHMQYDTLFNVFPALNAHIADYIVWTTAVALSQVCMVLSVAYHTFGCIGEREREQWLRADLVGISAGLVGMYLSGIYFSFYCFEDERNMYLATLSLIMLISMYVPSRRELQTKLWGTRFGISHLIYLSIALFGLYPTAHWIQLHNGLTNPHVMVSVVIMCLNLQQWLPNIVVLFVMLGIAFGFYLTLVPERFCPGKFDIIGCSHQWWHVIILAAMVFWHDCGVQLTVYYYKSYPQCGHLTPNTPNVSTMINSSASAYL